MATTTITRSTWTDDDGSGTTGSIINNAELQKIYANIDSLIAGDITWGGSSVWDNAKTFGYSDGYLQRTGANAVEFWNGTTLGTVLVGNLGAGIAPSTPVHAYKSTATTNAVQAVLRGEAHCTGTVANNFGASFGLFTQYSGGQFEGLRLVAITTDAAAGKSNIQLHGNKTGVGLTQFVTIDDVGNLTTSALFSAQGLGNHDFVGSTGAAGGNTVRVYNATGGATTYSAVSVLNGSANQSFTLRQNDNSFTTSTYQVQNGGSLVETGNGGISFVNTDASADFRFYCGTSTTQRFSIFASGGVSIGDTTDPGSGALRVTSSNVSAALAIGSKYSRGGTPTASANTINGSGGAAATIVTLPASSYGWVHIFMKRTAGSAFSYHAVPFVTSGASLQIYSPINPFLNEQLVLSISGLNLQAKSSAATAPDSVVYILEVYAQ